MIDAAGNEVHEGAILKVFHFRGLRNYKHFMYKQAGDLVVQGKTIYRKIYHLPLSESDGYYLKKESSVLDDSVVVQCDCDFHTYKSLKRNKFYGA